MFLIAHVGGNADLSMWLTEAIEVEPWDFFDCDHASDVAATLAAYSPDLILLDLTVRHAPTSGLMNPALRGYLRTCACPVVVLAPSDGVGSASDVDELLPGAMLLPAETDPDNLRVVLTMLLRSAA